MKVAFRTDASAEIGTGHLMRCLTLAEALHARGAEVRFIVRGLPEALQSLIAERGCGMVLLPTSNNASPAGDLAHSSWLGASQEEDAAQTLQGLADAAWDWLVVDHYALDHRWESAMRQVAAGILAIDDLADRRHDCDLLLDQNLYADMDTRYQGMVPAHAKLLLGPRYALLREEFRNLRPCVRPRSGTVRRILVFFGGVDAANHTGDALEALASLGTSCPAVDVVIGSGHPRKTEILHRCEDLGFVCHVQTRQMATLMANADLAIGAAGSATWERCCLGLPTIAVPVAANQVQLLEDAASNGLVWAACQPAEPGSAFERDLMALLANGPLRQHISQAGLDAVDGRGLNRVVSAMGGSGIEIHPATAELARKLFDWRNHPSIRAVSRDQNPIVWESHQRWLSSVLNDPDRDLLVGYSTGTEIGVLRFDVDQDRAEVSIYLVPGIKGPWSGRDLLLASERWIVEHRPALKQITAQVLGGNHASHGLFLSCGYQAESTTYSKRLS